MGVSGRAVCVRVPTPGRMVTTVSEWVALYSNGTAMRYVAADTRAEALRADHLAPEVTTSSMVPVVAIFTLDEWQRASGRIMAGYVSTVEAGEVGR